VCGDVKVVENGKGDGIYISTSGAGEKIFTLDKSKIDEGDEIIVTSTIGDHGAAVFQARNRLLQENSNIYSDCNSLVELIGLLEKCSKDIKFMRDPTRGGFAEVVLELAAELKREIVIEETKIPVKDWVKSLAYITGLDYLYLACEGNMVIVADKKSSENILQLLNKNDFKDASIIGKLGSKNERPATILNTSAGGRRHLTGADIAQIPRIC
jgi:hydrogenase expression/formation protein HypE